MKNDQYFKHDASASGNRKLMMLIREEGMRGYGAYWFLLELLRCQPGMCAPLSVLEMVACRTRTNEKYLLRIVERYDLFVIADGTFRSAGMDKRMKRFMARQWMPTADTTNVENEDNQLVISGFLGNVRIAEKSIAEKSNNNCRKAEPAAVGAELPPIPIRPWQLLVDEYCVFAQSLSVRKTH